MLGESLRERRRNQRFQRHTVLFFTINFTRAFGGTKMRLIGDIMRSNVAENIYRGIHITGVCHHF